MACEVVTCPFCGEPTEIDADLDESEPSEQSFIQDCDVCCHPIAVRARVSRRGGVTLSIDRS